MQLIISYNINGNYEFLKGNKKRGRGGPRRGRLQVSTIPGRRMVEQQCVT